MTEHAKSDEYLWSGKGEPDDDVARLETLLAPYGHHGTMPALPARDRGRPAAARVGRRLRQAPLQCLRSGALGASEREVLWVLKRIEV